ncbi:MAG TPA: lipopolysaccharide kinase InaA family protein [Methylotenera sp.]|nr:lipopolysaccharide kinase InaA family protein [Methylotenera sp.]
MINITEAGSQAITFPNTIALTDGSHLSQLHVVRTVPAKRIVCRALWNNQDVYAKVFFGKDAEKYALRDKQGIQKLLDAKIPTSNILFYGTSLDKATDGDSYVLILEAIGDAENIEVIWNRLQLCSNQRLKIATDLVFEVARHHNAGLYQSDLYFKNFLQDGSLIYTLDGDGIRPLPKFDSGQTCLRNLAALLSKLDVLEVEKWLVSLLKSYGKARRWTTLPRIELMQHLINVHRNKIARSYADKKVFRTCTDVQVNADAKHYFAVARPYADDVELSNVALLDESLHAPAFKKGNTCTVGLLKSSPATNDAEKIVIKRYNVKSLWHGVMRSFRKTRAAISWANAHRLKLLGIATIQPVSLLEERFFFSKLTRRSYFLSEFVDAPNVTEYFANEHDKVKRAELVKHIVELFYRLHLLKISHGDMKASNLKIVDNQPVLLDLDSMKHHRFGLIAKYRHARDLRRFMRNWQDDESLVNAFKKAFKVVYIDHEALKLAHIT